LAQVLAAAALFNQPLILLPGSFTGNLIGDDVTGVISNISKVTASYDGTSLGPLFAGSYVGPTNEGAKVNFAAGGAIVSFNPLANNFLFSTQPYSSSGWPGDYFYIIQPWNNGGPGNTNIAVQYSGPGGVVTEAFNGDYVPGNWSVSAVPEPASWAMMLLGFFGIGFMIRGSRRKRVALTA
jgi:hypothetical protein